MSTALGSSHLHARPESITPPNLATVRVHRSSAAVPPSDTTTPLPTRVAGEYELMQMLGRGGMGIVYLARQCGLKRKVAYKVLTHLGSLDPETLDRFRGEAETLAKLQHSGIVQVFDSGTSEGSPFLAMEYVAGGSLADKQRLGRMAARPAASVIATVAGAVGHAHAHGIIHRDLKPANILLTPDGQPKVADFGLARDLACEHLTRTGFIAGTPCYMSPEQLSGQRNLGPSVDVWALGVMLYELLAGTVPFAGGDPQQILTNILRHDPVSLRHWQPNLPHDLETICMKCLQKEPARRYATGTDLADDLLRYLDGQPILARPIGRIEKGVRWSRRNPLTAGLMAVTAVVLFTATAMSLALARRADDQRLIAEIHAERADRARAAEQKLREEAQHLAAAEKTAREEAERLAQAEKTAREDSQRAFELLNGLLSGVRGGNETKILDTFRKKIDEATAHLASSRLPPLLRAKLFETIAESRRNIGDFPEAIRAMEDAFAIRKRDQGMAHPDTMRSGNDLCYAYLHMNRGLDGVRVCKPIVDELEKTEAPDSELLISHLRMLRLAYVDAGMNAESDRIAERILAFAVRKYGADHPETEWVRVNTRTYYDQRNVTNAGVDVLKKAYTSFEKRRETIPVPFVWTRSELGFALLQLRRPKEALPYLVANFDYQRNQSGEFHPLTRTGMNNLLVAYEDTGHDVEALRIRWTLVRYYSHTKNWTKVALHAKGALSNLNRALKSMGTHHPAPGPTPVR